MHQQLNVWFIFWCLSFFFGHRYTIVNEKGMELASPGAYAIQADHWFAANNVAIQQFLNFALGLPREVAKQNRRGLFSKPLNSGQMNLGISTMAGAQTVSVLGVQIPYLAAAAAFLNHPSTTNSNRCSWTKEAKDWFNKTVDDLLRMAWELAEVLGIFILKRRHMLMCLHYRLFIEGTGWVNKLLFIDLDALRHIDNNQDNTFQVVILFGDWIKKGGGGGECCWFFLVLVAMVVLDCFWLFLVVRCCVCCCSLLFLLLFVVVFVCRCCFCVSLSHFV
jgi:hypothetical protein